MKEGLVSVMDNQCAQKKADGAVVKQRNGPPRSDVIRISDHKICKPSYSLGYVYRLVISFVFALGARSMQI